MTTLIIKLIITIVAIIVSYVFTKSKMTEDSWTALITSIEYAVRAAEQLYTKEEFVEKKQYVLTYIRTVMENNKIKLTEQDLNILIEGIVNEVKHPSV